MGLGPTAILFEPLKIFSTAEVTVISDAAVSEIFLVEAVAVELDRLWPDDFPTSILADLEGRAGNCM